MTSIQYAIESVCLDLLKRNPKNARRIRSEARLLEMTEDIKTKGIIQPPIAFRSGTDRVLADGHLRCECASLAGLKEITVLVCDHEPTEAELLDIQACTALHRQDLNPIDLSDLLCERMRVSKCTISELARIVSKDQSYITKLVKLRDASPEIRGLVRDAKVDTERAYMVVSTASDHKKQNELLKDAQSLSREQLRARLSSPKQNEVKTSSARFAMPGGVTVVVQAKELGLATCIEILLETVKQLKKGQSSGHDISTLPRVMRNQCRQLPKSALTHTAKGA